MNFFKSSLWSAATSGITMLCGLITTKYVAVKIGPAGMTYIGQFSNFVIIISLIASASINLGVTKYLAETDSRRLRLRYIANGTLITLIGIAVVMIGCSIMARYFSRIIFGNDSFYIVIVIYALLIYFPIMSGFYLSVLNGTKNIRTMSIMGITTSVFNVVIIILCAKYLDIRAVMLATIFSNILTFVIYIRIMRSKQLLPSFKRILRPQKDIVKKMFRFSVMSIVSGSLAPAIQLFIRTNLLHKFNASNTGLWQASTRISDYYLNFLVAVMGAYYLPKLSGLTDRADIRREIKLGYLRFIPFVLVSAVLIWLFRDLIIHYVLTERFRGMFMFLKWQLIGDVFKISANILIYYIAAKAMTRLFVGLELLFAVIYGSLSVWLIGQYGMIGAVYAFCINCLLYALTLLIILRHHIFGPTTPLFVKKGPAEVEGS